MIVLHTSDWHLGRQLFGKKREAEFDAFLNWLLQTLDEQRVDVLLVAGDVFDSSVPGHRAQSQYYRFLCRVAGTHCRHVVVIAGNHDSPSFIDAPKELLHALDVHVIGEARSNPADEVVVLNDPSGAPEAIACAVPYLRDRDLRTVEADESLSDKDDKLRAGVRQHYDSVAEQAVRLRAELGGHIPIIGMGHLFAAGGQVTEGDGVRDLYVGNLGHIHASHFPTQFDYLALGHLHGAQRVGGTEHIRYSGAPLAMGFNESQHNKVVLLVEFSGREMQIQPLNVPIFQPLECVRGDWPDIAARLQHLKQSAKPIWLEVVYDGANVMGDLRDQVEALVADSQLEVLRIRNQRSLAQVQALAGCGEVENLSDLDEYSVFERCLDAHEVPPEQRAELINSYREILREVYEEDPLAQ